MIEGNFGFAIVCVFFGVVAGFYAFFSKEPFSVRVVASIIMLLLITTAASVFSR